MISHTHADVLCSLISDHPDVLPEAEGCEAEKFSCWSGDRNWPEGGDVPHLCHQNPVSKPQVLNCFVPTPLFLSMFYLLHCCSFSGLCSDLLGKSRWQQVKPWSWQTRPPGSLTLSMGRSTLSTGEAICPCVISVWPDSLTVCVAGFHLLPFPSPLQSTSR